MSAKQEMDVEFPSLPRRSSAPKDHKVTLVISSSLIAAAAAAFGSMGLDSVRNTAAADTELMERRVREKISSDFDRRYVPLAVYEQRWSMFEARLNEQFTSLRADLATLREQTKDLPRLSAQLELLQRQSK